MNATFNPQAAAEIDDFAVERRSTLAGCVEGPLKHLDRCVERILGAVIDFAGLSHSLIGHGSHGLWNRGVETEEAELGHHIAVIFARLLRPAERKFRLRPGQELGGR